MARDTFYLPKHVAIVMDGNGRWAKAKQLPRALGHQAGAEVVQPIVEFAAKKKIEVLTLFALSVENLKYRPKEEIQLLMSLFLESLQNKTPELHSANVRIRVIGDRTSLDKALVDKINQCEKLTAQNTGLHLVIAINYSGRWDIVQATQQLIAKVQNNLMSAQDCNEESFQKFLCLSDLPEPDLLIRTGLEQRISNFMLWQFAYTELFFPQVFWPDFNEKIFEEALASYQSRQRRFGYTSEQVETQNA